MRNRPALWHGWRLVIAATIGGAVGTALWMADIRLLGQVPVVKFDVRAARGELVSPVYEGWYELGGTTYALFG